MKNLADVILIGVVFEVDFDLKERIIVYSQLRNGENTIR